MADLVALGRNHTGHAVTPIPVTENQRIPDMDEILDAQLFAARLADHAAAQAEITDTAHIDAVADRLLEGGRSFAQRVLAGFAELGVDTRDPAALMLAIRRMGARQMEMRWGIGELEGEARKPVMPVDWAVELDRMAEDWVEARGGETRGANGLRLVIGTTDVHEHGAYLVRCALEKIGAQVIEAGVAVDAERLVERAQEVRAQAIAISTYNGVGLAYARAVRAELEARGLDLPVMIGGMLNEIPRDSNSGLPVDVTEEIRATRSDSLPFARRHDPGARNLRARARGGGTVSAPASIATIGYGAMARALAAALGPPRGRPAGRIVPAARRQQGRCSRRRHPGPRRRGADRAETAAGGRMRRARGDFHHRPGAAARRSGYGDCLHRRALRR